MPNRKREVPEGPYTVVNRRKVPEGTPVIQVGDDFYYEGDTVEARGESTDVMVERGFLAPKKVRRNG